MKIRYFAAEKIHAYLNFDFGFNPDITFLTGINGSGKTSVVRGIFALISPSLSILARTVFKRMEVGLEHEGRQVSVWATQADGSLSLGASEASEVLEISIPGERGLVHPEPSEEREYYQELMVRNAKHPVLVFLSHLPTPMFLSIERRVTQDWLEDPAVWHRSIHWRRTRDIFHSLSASLADASLLAQQRFNQVQARLRDHADQLRKHIILAALQYQSADTPTQDIMQTLDLSTITSNVDSIKSTLGQLGLSDEDVEQQLAPFLERLVSISKHLPFTEKIDQLPTDPVRLQAYVEWTINRPQIDRLMSILQHVNRYISKTQITTKPLTQYLEIVNRFFSDSGKSVSFSKTGQLQVTIEGIGVRPITSLSSGESQLVVILTHLAFNPAAQSANVFMIDEPELSLHVHWQELFVSSIRGVNPQMQAILATHSPSIILDDVQHCVDLGAIAKK